mgnify:CR=1 FL=1
MAARISPPIDPPAMISGAVVVDTAVNVAAGATLTLNAGLVLKLRNAGVEVTVIAGRLGEVQAPPCPPESWAAAPENAVAIWTIRMTPGAHWTLPAATQAANRRLFFFRGSGLRIGRPEDTAAVEVESAAAVPEIVEVERRIK